jgi:lysophospholipase L1-like esterase
VIRALVPTASTGTASPQDPQPFLLGSDSDLVHCVAAEPHERFGRMRFATLSSFCLGLLMACSGTKSNQSAAGQGGSQTTAGTGGNSATGGDTAVGGSTATGGNSGVGGRTDTGETSSSPGAGGASSTCPKAPDLGVHFVGRYDGCDSRGVRFAWSGCGFTGKFRGTALGVWLFEMGTSGNQYAVLVDGVVQPRINAVSGEKLYSLASGLPNSEHTFEVYRRTEASFNSTIVMDFDLEMPDAGVAELLAPPNPPPHRIELIGDSISCGYGNEGTNPCSFSADTENHYLSYGAVLARNLNAELSTVAWSGKGVYYNYNGNRVEPMPTLYDRTVPTDKNNPWNFSWQPELVIINLGTNDYSTSTNPTDTQFVTVYQTFLEHIRSVNPAAFILCTIGPMLSGSGLVSARKNITAAVTARLNAGDSRVKYYEITTPNTNPGCDSHPSMATDAAMAAELATEIKSDLGW